MKKYKIKLDNEKNYLGGFISIRQLLECMIQYEADYNPDFFKEEEVEDLQYELLEADTMKDLIDTFNSFEKIDTKVSEMYEEELEIPTVEGWDTATKAVQNYKKFGQFSI